MPFGLCNAPGTFQRCMLAIFHDMVEKTMEVFMDDFSVFGNSFQNCLSRLDHMLQRCEDTNLSLNWEKSHFMVKEGIVLGHKISKKGIEVDKAKIDVIAKLPHPTTVKGIRVFLAPILIAPNWDLPFELMCDASDFAIGAVLGQRHEKHFRPIHYASKTLIEAQTNYTTTEKELLAIVYAFEKFRSYLIMNKSIVHTTSALRYIFAKKDAKARLLRCTGLVPTASEKTSQRDEMMPQTPSKFDEIFDIAMQGELVPKSKSEQENLLGATRVVMEVEGKILPMPLKCGDVVRGGGFPHRKSLLYQLSQMLLTFTAFNSRACKHLPTIIQRDCLHVMATNRVSLDPDTSGPEPG
ncbi:retrovirus-related pol polyprotein from transposon 17.6 [Tanacetum coccineum]